MISVLLLVASLGSDPLRFHFKAEKERGLQYQFLIRRILRPGLVEGDWLCEAAHRRGNP